MKNCLIFFPSIIFAKSLSVISELDTTKGYIGDIIEWTISVDGKTNQNIQFPQLNIDSDTITIKSKYSDVDKISFEIIVWDTGTFSTPEYSIEIYNNAGFLDYSIDVEPLNFSISSILSALDESAFRPMKGPVPVKEIIELRMIILSLLLFFTGICIVLIWRKRQKPIYEKFDYSIKELPRDKALRRLQELDSLGLTKEYYTELSHITREFFETKYFIRALEMTTDEIEKSRAIFPIDDSCFQDWVKFLYQADQVKYARKIPNPDQLSQDKEKMIHLIKQL